MFNEYVSQNVAPQFYIFKGKEISKEKNVSWFENNILSLLFCYLKLGKL